MRSFGGIFYTLSILGNLLNQADEIYPVCYLGTDIYDEIITGLSRYKNIKFSGIKKVDQANTAVKLVYKDIENRNEFLTNRLPQIEFDHFQQVAPVDIWLVNFITGFEMSLDTFRRFCNQTSGLIYVDFHSLALDINEIGKRSYRRLPNWEQWIEGVDVLQMNDAEASSLCDCDRTNRTALIQFGYRLLETGIEIVHITRGSKGSLLYYRDNNEVKAMQIPATNLDKVVDVTGCGDAFAAGFLVHYFEHHNLVEATIHANRVAGFNCTLSGTEELFKLKKVITEG